MAYPNDRMGLGTDGMDWLPQSLLDLPSSPAWLEWTMLPSLPSPRVSPEQAPATLPAQFARSELAPWAHSLELPGLGV